MSQLEISVYKEGLLKAFGHDHLIIGKGISGLVQFDAQKIDNSLVSLKVEAKSLTVIDPGESERDRRAAGVSPRAGRTHNPSVGRIELAGDPECYVMTGPKTGGRSCVLAALASGLCQNDSRRLKNYFSTLGPADSERRINNLGTLVQSE